MSNKDIETKYKTKIQKKSENTKEKRNIVHVIPSAEYTERR